MRIRMQTCKIILATSLIWFLIDVVLLLYYTDCGGNGCAGAADGKGPSADSLIRRNDEHVAIDVKDREVNDEDMEEEEESQVGETVLL